MQKQDNKSTLTGLVLIGIIFVAYSIFFPYTREETTDPLVADTKKVEIKTEEETNPDEDNTKVIIDSTETKKLDNQDEKTYTLENDKIKIIFTNKGGEIKSAIIKGFYTYDEYKKNPEERKDIEIFNNQDSKFEISA
ncbi:MAG: hypothetical protein HN702_03595, partial [Flavobacteriales bacterium]|nr:hypothetical protein [Flavobacteriales bacterium]